MTTTTGGATMARNICMLAGPILIGILLATVALPRPALAQTSACPPAVDQYQVAQAQARANCDETTVTVVPEDDPPGGGGNGDRPGGGGNGGVTRLPGEVVETGVADADVPVVEQKSPASAAPSGAASVSAATPAAAASAPGGSAVAEGEVSEASVLPDTGGPTPLLPLLAGALLLGAGVLAGGWILRSL
jgi:hypothetical protein